jgi:hypothetical protein
MLTYADAARTHPRQQHASPAPTYEPPAPPNDLYINLFHQLINYLLLLTRCTPGPPRQQHASPSHSQTKTPTYEPPAPPLAIDDETLREGIGP